MPPRIDTEMASVLTWQGQYLMPYWNVEIIEACGKATADQIIQGHAWVDGESIRRDAALTARIAKSRRPSQRGPGEISDRPGV